MRQFGLYLGTVVAAVAASACCILPALLGVAGAGTLGFGAALEPYRPYLLGLTVLLLGAAFYLTYRPVKCEPGSCPTEKPSVWRLNRAALWGIALFTVGVMAYPQVASQRAERTLARRTTPASPPSAASQTATKTVAFTVGGMTCEACTRPIIEELEKQPGVKEARIDFKSGRAVISYDPERVAALSLRDTIERMGYTVSVATGS